jgi:hypothetical protein
LLLALNNGGAVDCGQTQETTYQATTTNRSKLDDPKRFEITRQQRPAPPSRQAARYSSTLARDLRGGCRLAGAAVRVALLTYISSLLISYESVVLVGQKNRTNFRPSKKPEQGRNSPVRFFDRPNPFIRPSSCVDLARCSLGKSPASFQSRPSTSRPKMT